MSKVFQKVRTGINLGSLTADPSDPQAGDFYYNTVTNTFRQYLGNGGVTAQYTAPFDDAAPSDGGPGTTAGAWTGLEYHPTSSYGVSSIQFRLEALSSMTGQIICDLWNDVGGNPGVILSSSAPFNVAALPSGVHVSVLFTFPSQIQLTSGQTYYFVLRGNPTLTNQCNIDPAIGAQPGNSLIFTNNSGATWFHQAPTVGVVINGSSFVAGWHNMVGDDLFQLVTNKQLGFSSLTDSTTTGSDASIASPTTGIVRLTNASLVSLGGIPGGTVGLQVMIANSTGNTITIVNEDLSVATAANRILTNGANVSMPSGSVFTFIYSATLSRWQLVSDGGANTSLSNLTSPTSVNQTLLSSATLSAAVTSAGGSNQGYDMPSSFGTRGAENFTPGVSFSLTKFFWNAYTLQASGQTGNIRIAIYSNSAGLPNTLLGASDDLSIVGIPAFTNNIPLNFTFSTPVPLSAGTVYWWSIEESTGFGGTFRIGSMCSTVGAGGASHAGWNGSVWSGAFQTYNSTYTMFQSLTNNIGSAGSPWANIFGSKVNAGILTTASTTDSGTTGNDATLGSSGSGIVRLTNSSLSSLGGIPAGVSGQQIIVENKTGNQISVVNEDAVATAANRIQTGTGANAQMANNASFEFVYDSTSARWQLVGGTGSGTGGFKNYLTPIITSTSGGVSNVGNGNFEYGSTLGWSLAHSAISSLIPTSVAAPGTAFSATSGGTAASANLSLVTVTGGTQLAGSYSAEMISSAAGVAGDMMISSAFNIDAADQGKILPFSFSYKAVSGTFNFSGTSANTFAIYIYDVTNGVWISPVGVYNMVQGTGVGTATGSFQATSNTIKYQIALIDINAPAGAFNLEIDDFFVGGGQGAADNSGQGQSSTQQVFTAVAGTQTYTTPFGVQWLRVRLVGGGGGGGGSVVSSGSSAGGGGAGGYAETIIVNPLATYSYSVGGAGGSGTAGGGTGGTGGATNFGVLTGGGGAGGTGSTGNITTGGLGGGASGGQILINGGYGFTGSGNSNFATGGGGAPSYFGGGGYGGANTNAVGPATAGRAVGSGGGGGGNGNAGGTGASGIIIVEEYYSSPSGVGQGIGITGTVGFNVFGPTTSITSAGPTKIAFSGIVSDTNNTVSTSTFTQWTCPVSGLYDIIFEGAFVIPTGSGAATVTSNLLKNGASIASGSSFSNSSVGSGNSSPFMLSQMAVPLIAGDNLSVQMASNNGIASTTLAIGHFGASLCGGGVQATQNRVFAPPQLTSIAGSTTYTAPVGALYLKVLVHGAGGGGGPVTGSAGGTGGTTSLTGTGLNLVCTGGAGANPGNSPQSAPAGGTVTATTGLTVVYARAGGSGNSANNVTATAGMPGCAGWKGGAGGAGGVNIAGSAAATNSGAGGGGAGSSSVGGGGGGAAGAILEGIISNPNPSITYTATIGAAGTAGSGAANGGAGGSGYIEIWAHFQ